MRTETPHTGTAAGGFAPELRESDLASVPGVLGRIARERLGDYLGRDHGTGSGSARSGREGGTGAANGPVAQDGGRFAAALASPGLAIIAEVKRASPSQGAIASLDPATAARDYQAGGAAALSVLTEPRHFGGSLDHLRAVGHAVSLPLLRKDFTVHPAQLAEAAAAGADAVLLIVALLGRKTADYVHHAVALGLDALVEVHDEEELTVALDSGAQLIGVNNRDLTSLEIDLATAPRLLRRARETGYRGLLVAESGYQTRDQLDELEGLADAVLVGTSVAGAGDLREAVARLAGTR